MIMIPSKLCAMSYRDMQYVSSSVNNSIYSIDYTSFWAKSLFLDHSIYNSIHASDYTSLYEKSVQRKKSSSYLDIYFVPIFIYALQSILYF